MDDRSEKRTRLATRAAVSKPCNLHAIVSRLRRIDVLFLQPASRLIQTKSHRAVTLSVALSADARKLDSSIDHYQRSGSTHMAFSRNPHLPGSHGSRDGDGAGDNDQPYRFGWRPRASVPYPFSTLQYACLLIFRSHVRDRLADGGDTDGPNWTPAAA